MKQLKKINKIISYLGFSTTFIIVGILANNLDRYLKLEVGRHPNPYTYTSFLSFYPILIGLFIGMPLFINRARKKGVWKIEWLKLIFTGIPTLFFSLLYLMYFSPGIGIFLHNNTNFQLLVQPMFVTINGVMFGYSLISSFKKV